MLYYIVTYSNRFIHGFYVTTKKLISIIWWKYVTQSCFEETGETLLRCMYKLNFIKSLRSQKCVERSSIEIN